MQTTTVLFAKSVIMEFMRGPWGLAVFFGAVLLIMFAGFRLMKYLDNSLSYSETYHTRRG